MLTRRQVLSRAVKGAVSVGAAAPLLWNRVAAAAPTDAADPILVVLDLEGGNDGLNTVIPYTSDDYYRSRPTLAVDKKRALKLDERLGLHPAMSDLHKLWDAGQLCVVNNVGYPQPNRSHFRSREIWHSGDLHRVSHTGWLGRAADAAPRLAPCHVADGGAPLALIRQTEAPVSIAGLESYRGRELLVEPSPLPADAAEPLAEIQRRMHAARELSRRLSALVIETNADGERGGLRSRLATIRHLIAGGLPFRVYYTSQGGFDTHASQRNAHENLLSQMSRAVAEFLRELAGMGSSDRVMVLVVSEFGRRLQENGSAGTDHGAAAPVLLAGQSVRGGLVGPPPDLADVDDRGDIKFRIDFREVYATVLKQWLGIDPAPVLGQSAGELPIVS